MLLAPASNAGMAHCLDSHAGALFLHCPRPSPALLEAVPTISSCAGGRVADYRACVSRFQCFFIFSFDPYPSHEFQLIYDYSIVDFLSLSLSLYIYIYIYISPYTNTYISSLFIYLFLSFLYALLCSLCSFLKICTLLYYPCNLYSFAPLM